MKRAATAVWQGGGSDGKGHLSTQSKVLVETPYSFSSRFESGEGTNPEELIAAAHAGCFTMKLSFILGEAGFTPEKLETSCVITIEDGSITSSSLKLEAKVEGLSQEKLASLAETAKKTCPVSNALKTSISLSSKLV